MRGVIAVVAVLVCCMADPLAPTNYFVQTLSPPAQADQVQFENR